MSAPQNSAPDPQWQEMQITLIDDVAQVFIEGYRADKLRALTRWVHDRRKR